jgi:nicotinamide riboside kinase
VTATAARVIALLGAESTGKTTLSRSLAGALAADGHAVALVPEYLREFCEAAGRTPRVDEQAGIAAEQDRRIAAAAEALPAGGFVVADTTALTIAVYSEQVFGDISLYADALAAHRRCTLTLLAALDLPWNADGLMRDGPHVREPVDTLFRRALASARLPYSVVSGQGPARLAAALAAVRHRMARDDIDDEAGPGRAPRWQWHCDRCGDADCERHLLLPPVSPPLSP